MDIICPACGTITIQGHCPKCEVALGPTAIDTNGIVENILQTIVGLYGLGRSEQRIFEELSSHSPAELPLHGAIERVGRWHQFFLRIVREGWLERGDGLAAAEWAIPHFEGNVGEMETAIQSLPHWIKASCASDIVRDLTAAYVAQGGRPDQAAYARTKLGELREPVASIAKALWDSQPQRAYRQEATETPNGKAAAGCVVILGVALGALGCVILVVWCVAP